MEQFRIARYGKGKTSVCHISTIDKPEEAICGFEGQLNSPRKVFSSMEKAKTIFGDKKICESCLKVFNGEDSDINNKPQIDYENIHFYTEYKNGVGELIAKTENSHPQVVAELFMSEDMVEALDKKLSGSEV